MVIIPIFTVIVIVTITFLSQFILPSLLLRMKLRICTVCFSYSCQTLAVSLAISSYVSLSMIEFWTRPRIHLNANSDVCIEHRHHSLCYPLALLYHRWVQRTLSKSDLPGWLIAWLHIDRERSIDWAWSQDRLAEYDCLIWLSGLAGCLMIRVSSVHAKVWEEQ